MELEELKNTLTEIESLIKKAEDLTEDEIPQHEKDAILNMLEAARTSVDRALKDVEQVENVDEMVELGVQELMVQMEESSLYRNLTDETKGLIIHKIMNNTQYKLLTEAEFRDYVAKELALLSTDELIPKAYSKEDIIRAGQNVAPEANDQVKYEEGLNFLSSMSDTPSSFQDLLALAFNNVIASNDELLMYLKKYYDI